MKSYSATSFPNVKLRHLQFLLLLDRHRNLGRAADALQMSQPAASKLLAELERSIGAALFARSRNGVAPLAAAQPVLRFARVVQEEESLAVQALRSGPGAGVVRVGTLPTLPVFVLEGIRRSKSAAAVGRVVVRQDTVDALLPMLATGELDLVIGRCNEPVDSSVFSFERLAEDLVTVLAGASHPLVRRRKLNLDELAQWPWVVPLEGSPLHAHFRRLFAGRALPEDLIECSVPFGIHAILQDQRTLGFLTALGAETLIRLGARSLAIETRGSPGPLGFYTVRGRSLGKEATSLRSHIRDAAATKTDARVSMSKR